MALLLNDIIKQNALYNVSQLSFLSSMKRCLRMVSAKYAVYVRHHDAYSTSPPEFPYKQT